MSITLNMNDSAGIQTNNLKISNLLAAGVLLDHCKFHTPHLFVKVNLYGLAMLENFLSCWENNDF